MKCGKVIARDKMGKERNEGKHKRRKVHCIYQHVMERDKDGEREGDGNGREEGAGNG